MKRTRAAIAPFPDPAVGNDSVYEAICRDAAENVDADLVSVWKFQELPKRIVCIFAWDAKDGSVSKGQELLESDFPRYFQSIVEESVVCAPIAATHPMTMELDEPYFKVHGVISLLDFIVHHDYKPVGIICCESRSKRRDWGDSDLEYLRAIATLASFRTRI